MWTPEEILQKYISAIKDIEAKSRQLNILLDSISYSRVNNEFHLVNSSELVKKYNFPYHIIGQTGVLLNRRHIYEYLCHFGYSPSEINISMCTSIGKYTRFFGHKKPVRHKNRPLFTFAESLILMGESYSKLNKLYYDSISRYDFVNQNGLYVPNHDIIIPEINEELIRYLNAHPDKLETLSSRKFEELIADIFKSFGYNVELTPKSKDGGYDIIAICNDKLTGKHEYLVECKRYSSENRVGVGIVRSLFGVVNHKGATKGVITTTSSFTKGANEFATINKNSISLKDFNNIRDWLNVLSKKKNAANNTVHLTP